MGAIVNRYQNFMGAKCITLKIHESHGTPGTHANAPFAKIQPQPQKYLRKVMEKLQLKEHMIHMMSFIMIIHGICQKELKVKSTKNNLLHFSGDCTMPSLTNSNVHLVYFEVDMPIGTQSL